MVPGLTKIRKGLNMDESHDVADSGAGYIINNKIKNNLEPNAIIALF